jgi:hypothetical protein
MGVVSLSRVLFGILLVINLAALGFTLGGMLAARFLTPPEEGFSGAVLVALYGSGGALIGMITGILLARKVAADRLLRVTLGVIALSGLAIGIIFLGIAK